MKMKLYSISLHCENIPGLGTHTFRVSAGDLKKETLSDLIAAIQIQGKREMEKHMKMYDAARKMEV